jgi:hypothetical protein
MPAFLFAAIRSKVAADLRAAVAWAKQPFVVDRVAFRRPEVGGHPLPWE